MFAFFYYRYLVDSDLKEGLCYMVYTILKEKMVTRGFMTLFCIFILTDLTLAQWSRVGESQPFTFTAAKSVPQIYVNWILQKENTNISLFTCKTSGVQCDAVSDTVDLYSASITSNSSFYTSVLTIKHILPSHYKGRLFCVPDSINVLLESVLYDINIFAVAELPTCDDVTLLNEEKIQIKCWTQKVLPESICVFNIKTNASLEQELSEGTIGYTHDQNVTSGYYTTNCTYTVTAASLGPGSHKFSVVMYPNIPTTITEDMKTSSNYTKAININYPKAVLAADCHVEDYVKESQATNCTCYDNSTSFLPIQVTWSAGTSINGTLTFRPDRNAIADMNFQCTVSNILGVSNTIVYLPKVAYPPNPRLSLSNTSFDLCFDKNFNITGRCNVSDGYPESTVSIYTNNDLLDTKHIFNSSQHEFSTPYTSTGVVNVTCLADNRAFSISRTQYIYIRGPPEAPKLLTLLRQDSVTSLDKTQPGIIMCQCKGGFPSYKQLTLTCDSMVARATNSDTVSLEVNMTQTHNNINCTCDVLHESRCLQNKTTGILSLAVIDSPSEINSAAIAIGVILGLCVIGLTVAIIVILRRNQRSHGGDTQENKQKKPDYNSVKAIPYVNTEQHGYQTVNNSTSYINEALSANPDRHNPTFKREKDDHTYDEVDEINF